ncbi:Translation machinery-associated protein 7 [Rhodotorula mucilaginosa]|uniref:Translation machinery-associated protein 7 n=1 Tax=Rhodotorula mucilaginosa TaxID=5537 RepID=A0A9P6VT66_RHOMI|nr:Translation machinery-associated protein 7 [Rhodotorula mucilaginosa]
MSGRQGGELLCTLAIPIPIREGATTIASLEVGKLKPLKAPKKKNEEVDEDDAAFKAKQKAEAAKLKEMQTKAAKGGPLLGGGL